MEEKEKNILEFMSDKSYVPMKGKELAQILMVPKEEIQDFNTILKKLEESYQIRKNRKGRYFLVTNEYIEGIFKGNQKGYGFVKPILESTINEIYISPENTNGCLSGDTVLVEIIAGGTKEKNAEGRIIKVIKREKDTIVGLFKSSKNFAFVIPDDKNFGTDIFISKKNFGKARNNHKVVVKILKYPSNGKKAEGEVIEVIGNINEAGVDMLSLIKEYNLPYEFPENVVEEAKAIKPEISKKDIPYRKDYRDQIIFTIDGEDAKDLDDAIMVEKKENGNYILGVHIADVSYYVKEGSWLDKEAIIRGTSIYMLGRVIPMLPRELSNGICSLNAGEDRFTLSVIMEIDPTGKVIANEVEKGIINVTERMTYTDVAKILDRSDKEVCKRYESYLEKFDLMKELSDILSKKREEEGSLDLDLPESKVILNEEGRAIDIQTYEITDANTIIEQFMLKANETIAERFYWLEAPFIYRVHEIPDADRIDELNKFLYNFGYKVKGNKENIHPKAFSEVLKEVKGKPEEKVVSNLILRTLKLARYEGENKGHFGLASKYYCHFTSPIRRYPDLFIHRIISIYLDKKYNVLEEIKDKYAELTALYAQSSSEREKIAQKVERESVDIKKAEYMQDKIGNIYEGIISSVTSFGTFVELENTVEGLIRFENLGNEFFIYDEDHKLLIGEHTNTVYKIGDTIKVKVIEANKELRRVSFAKVD